MVDVKAYVVVFVLTLFLEQSKCSQVVVHANVGDIAGNTERVVADDKSKVITLFTNIPYAESTAGPNRFLKPIPKAPFKETYQAVGNPVGCFQSSKAATQRLSSKINFTDDCLILNIYVPHDFTQNTSLPVMIWIYGGAFVEGASGLYRPDVMVALTDVIVVTVNYRLGMFGFLRSNDGKLPGNQGLWDQHLAIKWVHENIASFTGDNKQVTIFGESAGSASVLYQALYPGNQGYFQRVIAESGSPLADWALLLEPNADLYFAKMNCESSSDPEACLRAKTSEQLQIPRIATDPLKFAPLLDGDFIPESAHDILFGNTVNPKSIASRTFYSSLDILTGVNNYDGALYMVSVWPYVLHYSDINNPHITRQQLNDVYKGIVENTLHVKDNKTAEMLREMIEFEYTNWTDPSSFLSTRVSLLNISSDVGFFFPAISAAQGHVASNGRGKTYFYEFSYEPVKHIIVMPTWIHGANHADELDYVFGKPLLYNSGFNDDAKSVARSMIMLWTNFAKSG
ncbi:Carboxylesterase 5A [Mactra antiquata]